MRAEAGCAGGKGTRVTRRRRKKGPTIGDALVVLLAAALLAWFLIPGAPEGAAKLWKDLSEGRLPGASASLEDVAATPSGQLLMGLGLREGAGEEIPEYDRGAFGQAWADEDRNGCDTRNDILARDLARPVFKPGTHDCVVLSGTLAEPYTGSVIEFQRGQDTSALVQIDHVVALGDAWRSGAWAWDAPTRQRFANDPANLLAVDGQANQDKGASSADQWLPSNADFRCAYVTRQIEVKSTWGLSVTARERDAMAKVLASCPAQ